MSPPVLRAESLDERRRLAQVSLGAIESANGSGGEDRPDMSPSEHHRLRPGALDGVLELLEGEREAIVHDSVGGDQPREGQRFVDPSVVEERIDERGDAVDLEVERTEP